MPEPRRQPPQAIDPERKDLPREVIIATPEPGAIAEAIRAFLRIRLLSRARHEPNQVSRSDNL